MNFRKQNYPRSDGPQILVIGSSNTDLTIKVARIPKPGETILGGKFARADGGKGANQAVAAARAGGKVAFIARIGCDANGEQALANFAAEGIDVKHVIRGAKFPSGVAFILIDQDGENSIAVAPGANDRLNPADIYRAKRAFRRARIVLLQLETPLPTVAAAIKLAAASGVQVVLNPAPARPLPARLLRHVYLVTPNQSEAELLTGVTIDDEAAAAKAADQLLARGVKNVIITMGFHGAFVAGKDLRQMIPGFKV